MLLSILPLQGQDTFNITRSPLLDSLENKHIAYNQKYPSLGYRILIFSESGNYSQRASLEAQTEFDLNFPLFPSYLSYEEPYFKIKVGNYRCRLSAYRDLRSLQLSYPNAYIVVDAIEIKNEVEIETSDSPNTETVPLEDVN